MERQQIRSRQMLLGLLVVATVAGGLIVLNERLRDDSVAALGPQPSAGALAPRIGAPFSLVDPHGRPVSDRDLHGTHALLVFVRLDQDDRLAAALQVTQAALSALGIGGGKLRPVLIALAANGTEDATNRHRIAERLAPHGTDWLGLAAPQNDVRSLARSYFVPIVEEPAAKPPGDTVENPMAQKGAPPASAPLVVLLDAGGGYAGHLVVPNDPAVLAHWIGKKL